MLGAQLAPWRLWRSRLGQNGVMCAAGWDSAQTRSQGLRGLKKTVTLPPPFDAKLRRGVIKHISDKEGGNGLWVGP
jgi:hypothetical protein